MKGAVYFVFKLLLGVLHEIHNYKNVDHFVYNILEDATILY